MPPPLIFNDNKVDEIDDEELEDNHSILDLAKALIEQGAIHHLKIHYRSESKILFEPSRKVIYEKDGIQQIFEAGNKNKISAVSTQDNLGMDDKKNFDTIVKYIREKLQIDPDCSFCLLFSRKDVKDNFDE